jgi:hypothetical protein
MYFQFPLETVVSRRAAADQLSFAREASRLLTDSDEVMYEPVERGLAILAANESALREPRLILRDRYGELVDMKRPSVRYVPGEPVLEPIMHVRVTARREYAAALLAELRRRDARILEECVRSRMLIVRAEAPLARLLGLPAFIDEATDATAMHSIRLVRYAPIDREA